MDLRFQNDRDFEDFKRELKNRLASRERRAFENDGRVRAAVMMLFMNKNNSPHVLLTKRSQKVRTHKGQVSFPGGVMDDDDGDLLRTAYRETFEEVGIPEDRIEYIGVFDDHFSITGFHVTPYVGAIPHPFDYVFNEDEIDDYLEAPLSMFTNGEYDRVERYYHGGDDYNVYYYSHEGHVIWGLTSRIMTDFSKKVINAL